MDGNMLSYKSHSNSTGDDGSRLLVSATREPRSKGDSGFPIVGFGRLSRRAPRTIVGSRLLASAMREPRVQFKFEFKASCAEEVVPNGTFPQGFAPDRLRNGLSRACAEEVVPKGAFPQGFAPDGLLDGLPSACAQKPIC